MMIKVNHGLPEHGLVPIRTVSTLTGVNSVTLRAWERRYDLIKPIRTPKGHRLYSMADVDLIHQVVALLDSGISIGQARQALDGGPARGAIEIEAEPDRAPCHSIRGEITSAGYCKRFPVLMTVC